MGIHCDWLLAEHMQVGFNRSGKMHWTEGGRCGKQDDVDLLDNLLVGMEADEATLFRDLHAVAIVLLQSTQAALETIGEQIPDRPEDGLFVGAQGLHGSTGAAATATDQGADPTA